MMNESKDIEMDIEDAILENANNGNMLDFEVKIFLDIVRTDGLVIAAKGVNLDLVILNILKVYQDPGNLVIILNTTESEQRFFKEKLNYQHIYSEHQNGNEREEEYLCGGLHFLSTRILVVDLLKKRIPTDKITGMIVLRAHRIFESCNEAFALRLYRQNNQRGFVKAFSNSAQSFTMGFCHVDRVMRALFVNQLYIWPRFHLLICDCLKKYQPQVVELHIPITDLMKKIQTYILELMNLTVKELKKLNPPLEMQDVTVENCITKNFHKILQAELNTVWHQLSNKSCQLIAELKTLRHLLLLLFYTDSVTFYSNLLEYRKPEYARNTQWVLNNSAELLFKDSTKLVFTEDREFNPQFCPKWEALMELLKVEIPAEISRSKNENNTILILCSNNRTCYQLNMLLRSGPQHYLLFLALKNKIQFKRLSQEFKDCHMKIEETRKEDQNNELNKNIQYNDENAFSKEEDENAKFESTYILTMNDPIKDSSTDACNDQIFTPVADGDSINLKDISKTVCSPTILIQTFKGGENYISLQNTLEALNPNFLIMYHSNVTAIRDIEMYEAHNKNSGKLKTYVLIHAGTVEEQSYLTLLRREKEAFEFLIQTKAQMVIPSDQDGKNAQCITLQKPLDSSEKNTRQGGQVTAVEKSFVIVDMREFRSDLPSLIHKRGIDIEPLTITVGDYILTNEICVERKSISDLIQSLNSGRLYQQCTQMQRYYSKPMLLIEFEQNGSFSWQNQYMLSEDSTNFDIQQKLLLLTIHFPKLKIIWSPSPYATAQLFEELKVGDYILTNEICVERKSISDLIQSLNSGRLYQQCTQMQRYYSKPMLLIEFEQNGSFSWQNQYMLSEDSTNFDIQQKLLLLTIHFPKLKIIWSPSPYATAQLFEELKQGKEEPTIENALAIGCDQDLDIIETKYNSSIYDFMQKLPGITTKNIHQILRNGINLGEIIKQSEVDLDYLFNNSIDARAFHSALHQSCIPEKNDRKEEFKQKKSNFGRGKLKRSRNI